MATRYAIEAGDLYFSYNGEPILKDAELRVPEGEFLAILGPNGSGKTTLLKLLLGILKPQRGYIRIFGKSPNKVSHMVGYVPQHTTVDQSFPISVLDVVLMGRLGQKKRRLRYSHLDRKLAQESLEQVGMWQLHNRSFKELSGGERQRVLIARALAAQPKLLLMDEPTASVDIAFQKELFLLLKELNRAMTIVVVSHDMSVLSTYVHSVACINRRIYYHDKAEITSEMLENVYPCPVELIAHGIPHRVLKSHEDW